MVKGSIGQHENAKAAKARADFIANYEEAAAENYEYGAVC